MPAPFRHPAFKVIAINLLVLAVCAALIEAVFGAWLTGRNYGLLVVPRDVVQKFDVSGLYGGGIAVFRRDAHGLRGTYADPGEIDILTIGGSTTNEILVGEGQTWSDRLAAEFAAAGRPLTVVNAGVDGQSTVGHIKNFEAWFPTIPGLKARYVLAFVGINDLARVTQENYDAKQDKLFEPYKRVRQLVENNSALYGLWRTARGMLAAKDAKLVHGETGYNGLTWAAYPATPDIAAADARHAAALDAYETRLRDLTAAIRAFGAEPILVTQARADYRLRDGAVFGRIRPDGTIDIGLYPELTALNRRTMRTCAAVGAICVDLGTDIRFDEGDHYDPLHTTPQGSAKIARFLFAALKDRL